MSSRLSNECYQLIFSNIQDTKTLFYVIQVNHVWCENNIVYEVDLINHSKIIPVLLSFLKKGRNTLFDYPCFITQLAMI